MINACFAWSMVAALYPIDKYVNRKSSYPYNTKVLNLTSIEYPITLKKISKGGESKNDQKNCPGYF